ncbi:MAG: ABC transporter substrate-binding protein [Actinomycetota bacterium]|nr:ABC transporter substrate-binding protein [Actinomycetota bacterium]
MRSQRLRRVAAVAITTALVLSACGDDEKDADATTTSAATAGSDDPTTTAGDADPLAGLYQECLDNGAKVNLIALPDEWANYQGILASFRDKYPGVENPVASPDASSKEEMEAVQTLSGQDDMPDNVDVSPAIAQEMVDAGLFEPYVLSTDSEIPDGLKDADSNWTAAYYGIMAILTNTTIVPNAPTSFADLMKPEYKGLVALNGDPRESGAAFAAVMNASIANGGSADDILPGIEYFAELKKSGNLGGTDVTKETVLSGETPIALDWSYNLPGLQADLEAAGLTVEVNFPSDGVYGGFYGQGVIKDSPHQACSQLWLEHIFSNEGALGYLEGGAVPARIEALNEAGLVTDEMKVNLPPDELISQVAFLTPAQIAAAKGVLAEQWGPMVADA